jgi:hypothetical protein
MMSNIKHSTCTGLRTLAFERDLNYLLYIGAIAFRREQDPPRPRLFANLDWPTQITETEFFKRAKDLPKGKVHSFLSG